MRRTAMMKAAAAFAALAVLCGCGGERVERLEWTTMGTVAAVQARVSDGVHVDCSTVKGRFSEVERLLNAHAPQSELSRLAPLAEDEILEKCDVRMRLCYETAFRLARESGGAFNPRWRGPGTLDLGAIAKGFAVDFAVEGFSAEADFLVDLGGNLKATGLKDGARGWTVGVKDPAGDGFVATVRLKPGEALATSAEYYRGKHIYDGRTGKPAQGGVKSVTVLCRSAMLADGLSTTLFILGPDEGRRFLGEHGYAGEVTALFVTQDGVSVCGDESAFSIRRP